MSPLTTALLRAEAALVVFAQAHPTDAKGIQLRRAGRSAASLAWIAAGCPDLPAEVATPSRLTPVITLGEEGRSGKDWTRHDVIVDVLTITDGGVRLTRGDGCPAWFPKALVVAVSGPAELAAGEVAEVKIPAWLLAEKGWR